MTTIEEQSFPIYSSKFLNPGQYSVKGAYSMLCDEYSSNTLKNYKPNSMETSSTQQNQAISLKGVPTSHKINFFKRKVNLALNVMTIRTNWKV